MPTIKCSPTCYRPINIGSQILVPGGEIEVSQAVYEKVQRTAPYKAGWILDGGLTPSERSAAEAPAIASLVDIKDVDVVSKIIAATTNPDTIRQWAQGETRGGVVSALAARLAELTSPAGPPPAGPAPVDLSRYTNKA